MTIVAEVSIMDIPFQNTATPMKNLNTVTPKPKILVIIYDVLFSLKHIINSCKCCENKLILSSS